MKRLALCFMGHLRTYKQTHESFFKNILSPNLQDGWEVDIFIHTWDEFEKSGFAWHNSLESLNGKKVNEKIIDEVKQIYRPKDFLIETLKEERGMHISCLKTQELARKYAIKNHISYDYTLVTRPDLYFHSELRLDYYIDFYKNSEQLQEFPLPKKHIFVAHNLFGRMPVHDSRYICEADLLWFGNFNPLPLCFNTIALKELIILIDYRLHRDFYLQRANFRLKWNDPESCKIISAEAIVREHLSYKLGVAAWQCESWSERLRLLFVFSHIKHQHLKDNKEKMDANVLLQECKDYVIACEIKSSSLYRLGAKIIQIHKQKGTIGLIFFVLFKINKQKKKM